MRRESWKPFLAGVAAGIPLGAVLLLAAFVGLNLWMMRQAEKGGLGAGRTPAVPISGQSVYGRVTEPLVVISLAGDTLALEPRRDRVAVVNVWATWCAPCVSELPSFAALRDSLSEEPIDFYFLSKEPLPELRRFVEQKQLDLPVYRLDGFLPEEVSSAAIPLTLVIDREGFVVFRQEGAANWDREAVRRFLREVCATPEGAG